MLLLFFKSNYDKGLTKMELPKMVWLLVTILPVFNMKRLKTSKIVTNNQTIFEFHFS